jgi:radical SAM superfamily enzyme YgiQ (UPF0313 family)
MKNPSMNILLVTPPLTQLNTPYPATAYLTGFLKSRNLNVHQADIGIELVNRIFTKESIEQVFQKAEFIFEKKTSKNIRHIFTHHQKYIHTINAVMKFLRGEDLTIATRICSRNFLPEASRFQNMADLGWAFGHLGLTDRARHLATLYIEDLTDFIRETISPYFELGRYAEQLSLFADDFSPLENAIHQETNLIDALMLEILEEKMVLWKPDLIGFSIPFPGNLYGAIKCGQYLKSKYPDLKIAWGGGYVSTELRSLKEPMVFGYTDFILLDSGEAGLIKLVEHVQNNIKNDELVKTFVRDNSGRVVLKGSDSKIKIPFAECGNPDYSDLPLNQYISMIELANPMHKLWSDGRWNKLTLAQGCYWAKCAFCDTSLPYICDYEPVSAKILADRIENVIDQTKGTGFHFVDEAAPPKVLRELSKEITDRKLTVSWWTNIRFEKSFDAELCELISEAGCIAVSGGIEVASNRLLKLMNKGVTIEQAATSAFHLTKSGIMVHAYLMYGFPSETLQETIDSFEIVRQLFEQKLIQSAFWHRYAMTIHSPSGINPENYGARHENLTMGAFANNEISFSDHQTLDLTSIGEGLRKATYNYMHGNCIDWPVYKWFDIKIPKTSVPSNYIKNVRGR